MLMAYDDLGYTTKDIPADDPRVDLFPIESLSKAKKILAWAMKERLEVHWMIESKGKGKGQGPFRVRGTNP